MAAMTEIDLNDDDALRFVQRVLEGDATEQDRQTALDMITTIRTRIRKNYLTQTQNSSQE